jgi:hypothetical protein
MAKFIIGVVVGIFLGASASVYGAVAAGSGTLSGWTVTKRGENVCSGPNTTEACGRRNGSHSWRANLSR